MVFSRLLLSKLLVLLFVCSALIVFAGDNILFDRLTYQSNQSVSEALNKVEDQKRFDEQHFYQVLLAELYHQSDSPILALKHYLPVALKSDDPALVKRVTEIATATAQLKKGLTVAKHWVAISPKDVEAQQYLTLLLLRDGQLIASANQLHFIREIVDSSDDQARKNLPVSKGLKFIGALLVIESHHEKAYQVYTDYLKQITKRIGDDIYNDQKQLILASLAMNAKQYEVVVSALDNMKIAGSNHFSSAATMKMKALKALGRVDEATLLLQQIVNSEKASDSLRLEFTRLLISMGKKAEATKILDTLVVKHPDNNDLLKALVAINISQQQWQVARRNNDKLSQTDAYLNEANYFKGEIFEGEGRHKQALSHYKKVIKGVFLKSSHRKTAKLLVQIEGLEASQQWLHSEQKRAQKNKDKAYWLKLEADVLADRKLSNDDRGFLFDDVHLKTAIKLYDKVVALSPKKASSRYHRGLLYERTQQLGRAENDFNFVIKKVKNPASALNALGFLLLKHTTRLDEAKRYIKKAYSLKPNDPMILDSMGWVYFRTGDMKKAEGFLRKAYKALKTPEVASHFIAVLTKLDKNKEAKNIFNTMIKKHPNNASLDGVRSELEHI